MRAGDAQCALEDEKAHASGDHYAHEELRELLNAERLHTAYDSDGNGDERSAMVPKVRRANRTILCRWPPQGALLSAEVSEDRPRAAAVLSPRGTQSVESVEERALGTPSSTELTRRFKNGQIRFFTAPSRLTARRGFNFNRT